MNNQMVIFEGIDIEVLEADFRIWFRATEVCKLLEFTDSFRSVKTHCREDQYREWKVGKGRPALYVTESGLYRLIMRSKAPIAIKFQDWVCDELLPSIRLKGFYASEAVSSQLKEALAEINKIVNFQTKATLPDRLPLLKEVLGELEELADKHDDDLIAVQRYNLEGQFKAISQDLFLMNTTVAAKLLRLSEILQIDLKAVESAEK